MEADLADAAPPPVALTQERIAELQADPITLRASELHALLAAASSGAEARGEAVNQAVAELYTELHEGIARQDDDGSPNWWMFADKAREYTVSLIRQHRERAAAAEARVERLMRMVEIFEHGWGLTRLALKRGDLGNARSFMDKYNDQLDAVARAALSPAAAGREEPDG